MHTYVYVCIVQEKENVIFFSLNFLIFSAAKLYIFFLLMIFLVQRKPNLAIF